MPSAKQLWPQIDHHYLIDESHYVNTLLEQLSIAAHSRAEIDELAQSFVIQLRQTPPQGIEAFLNEFDLSTQEGIVLMCLAEALLRIPDEATVDRLIQDKLGHADWRQHLGHSSSLFVNATTWGLMLTGAVVNRETLNHDSASALLNRLLARSGEPIIRLAIKQAMKIIGRQFVIAETIDGAVACSQSNAAGYLHSFDMLGEAALTQNDAERYYRAYMQAIEIVGQQRAGERSTYMRSGVSIKLSALHPRYELIRKAELIEELIPKLRTLVHAARDHDINLTIDAEESERLSLSLEIFEQLFRDPTLGQWHGLGLAVQAYQKRACAVIAWLEALASEVNRRIPIRLVKGAYWDREIKRAQERGLSEYPVFTRKSSTDLSYLTCAQRLLRSPKAFYPQFATHNAQTAASIIVLARGSGSEYEFQRLHGMGEALHDTLLGLHNHTAPCRIYAPVGDHSALLPYLVRRLLENGANTSFINRIYQSEHAVEQITRDPISITSTHVEHRHPHIPLPSALYQPQRLNSLGPNIDCEPEREQLIEALTRHLSTPYQAASIVDGDDIHGQRHAIHAPHDEQMLMGHASQCEAMRIEQALESAHRFFPTWSQQSISHRAALLETIAECFEGHQHAILALLTHEAGKTLNDAIAELREGIDFCRYYAETARTRLSEGQPLPGPTGEQNTLYWAGRGVFLCISPWNFPFAIFVGQIAAALVSGNTVIAKPASQTPLIAHLVVRLMLQAGVPKQALHLAIANGRTIATTLIPDNRVAGIAFTGSTDTAHTINRILAQRNGAIVPLIAETGGQNAMIVDSSALLEQVAVDVLQSAFNSAGQRCSALRVLYVQEDVTDRLIELVSGAMRYLRLGDPLAIDTDIGPVIDQQAKQKLHAHCENLTQRGHLLAKLILPESSTQGCFFPPHLFEIAHINMLHQEVFGPVVHLIRFKANEHEQLIEQINNSGYGLTVGIQSRIDETINAFCSRLRVGNIYVNRNIVGAVVGTQPFGGEGLSGTGLKAGGPHYLYRFATERVQAINTTAMGGNTSLLTLADDSIGC